MLLRFGCAINIDQLVKPYGSFQADWDSSGDLLLKGATVCARTVGRHVHVRTSNILHGFKTITHKNVVFLAIIFPVVPCNSDQRSVYTLIFIYLYEFVRVCYTTHQFGHFPLKY